MASSLSTDVSFNRSPDIKKEKKIHVLDPNSWDSWWSGLSCLYFCILHALSSQLKLNLFTLCSSEHLPSAKRQKVLSSFPHYGHAGIVESARELFMQIDGEHGDKGQEFISITQSAIFSISLLFDMLMTKLFSCILEILYKKLNWKQSTNITFGTQCFVIKLFCISLFGDGLCFNWWILYIS